MSNIYKVFEIGSQVLENADYMMILMHLTSARGFNIHDSEMHSLLEKFSTNDILLFVHQALSPMEGLLNREDNRTLLRMKHRLVGYVGWRLEQGI